MLEHRVSKLTERIINNQVAKDLSKDINDDYKPTQEESDKRRKWLDYMINEEIRGCIKSGELFQTNEEQKVKVKLVVYGNLCERVYIIPALLDKETKKSGQTDKESDPS